MSCDLYSLNENGCLWEWKFCCASLDVHHDTPIWQRHCKKFAIGWIFELGPTSWCFGPTPVPLPTLKSNASDIFSIASILSSCILIFIPQHLLQFNHPS